jgi:hypothetical protein
MVEEVGVCTMCNKTVYCIDGFLNGMLNDQSELLCFHCFDENKISEKD